MYLTYNNDNFETMAKIYQTQKFKEQTASFNFLNDIEELERWDKVEDKGTVYKYDNSFFVYSNKTRNSKFIIEKRIYNNETVYFLREYSDFGRKWDKIKKDLENGNYIKLSETEITKIIKEQAKKTEYYKKQRLPEKLSWYEGSMTNYIFNVFEIENWVGEVNKLEGREKNIYKLIKKTLKSEVKDSILKDKEKCVYQVNDDDFYIIYKQQNSSIKLLGCGLLNTENTDKNISKIIANHEQPGVKAYSISINEKDDNGFNFWLNNIQKTSKAANLALHEEQTRILENEKPPIFVNGQAGSGKSTMLYYLLADITVSIYLYEISDNSILFLTENEGLLEASEEQIRDILQNNHKFAGLSNEEQDKLKPEYLTFENLILNKLLDKSITEDLNILKFEDFKKEYKNGRLKEMKNYPAEYVWYVINTYIDGYFSDKPMTPEDFEKLSKSEKEASKVNSEDFSTIYEIWRKFYTKLKEKEGYWDRNGLVKKILNEQNKLSVKYSFIFCDEAQDFSRVELQLLTKLSEFLEYDYDRDRAIPVFFAGDPFQTVNPTGFSLNNMKDLLNETLINQIGLKKGEVVHSLKYNYRSRFEIVKLANFIQFYRYNNLAIEDIENAQIPAQLPKNDVPLLFSTKTTPLQFGDKLDSNVVYIVHEDFNATTDEWFKQHSKFDQLNIKTTIDAKGAEYQKVVVFKFGDYYVERFGELNSEIKKDDFPISFFFNKLYVAITRATHNLIILDTEQGIKQFWKYFQSEEFKQVVNENSIWFGEQIEISKYISKQVFIDGELGELPEFDKADALKIAEEDRKTGILQNDWKKLESAAKIFRFHNEEKRAIECEAKMYEFKGEYENAGDKYDEIEPDNKKDETLRCYFIAGCWSKIIEIQNQKANNYYWFADLMQNKNLHTQLIEHISIIFTEKFQNKLSWKNEFLVQLEETLNNNINNFAVTECKTIAQKLAHYQIEKFDNIIAQYFYKANDYKNAAKYWEHLDKKPDNYYYAKIKTDVTPDDKIYYYSKLRDNDKRPKHSKNIIDIFEKNKNRVREERNIVFEAYIKEHSFQEALQIYKKEFDWSVLKTDKKLNSLFIWETVDYIKGSFATTEILNIRLFEHFDNVLKNNEGYEYLKKANIQDEDIETIVINLIKLIPYSNFDHNSLPENFSHIREFIKGAYNQYKTTITIEEACSSIERLSSYYIDVIRFYEKILKEHDLNNKEIEFIINRYEKNIIKKAEFDNRQNQKDKEILKSKDKENLERIKKGLPDDNNYTQNWNKGKSEKKPKKTIIQVWKEKIKYKENEEKIKKLPVYPQPIKKLVEKDAEKPDTSRHKELFNLLYQKHEENNYFRFTLRESNLYRKLEMGFWFEGDADTIEVSFWKGIDGKDYNAAFIIEEDETCKFQLSAVNSEKIAKFFEKYTKQRGGFFRRKREGKELNIWIKEFDTNDYKKNLDEFLSKDKEYIDFALGFELNEKYDSETLDGFRFITENEFLDNIRLIEKYKKTEFSTDLPKDKTEYPIKLNTLKLINIGRFENLKLKLNKKITCIIGENGIGKSTILSAIPLALTGVNENTLIDIHDKRLQDKLRIESFDEKGKKYYKEGEIILEYETNRKHTNTIEFRYEDLKGVLIEDKGTENDFVATTGENNNYFKNLILGFPQAPGNNQNKDFKIQDKEKPNIGDIISLIMYYPDDKLKGFSDWLKVKFEQRDEKDKQSIKLIHNVFTTISDIVSDNDNTEIEFITIKTIKNDKIILVKTPDNPNGIDLDLISQGLTNVFTWIGHFMSRLYEAYPDTKNIFEEPAILFIDEIDKYLHPKWQKRILKVLLDKFKNTQFIITTHSPLVLDGLEKGQIAHLKLDESGKPTIEYNEDFNIWGWEYQDILERWMLSHDPYNYNLNEEEKKLKKLKQQGKPDEEIKEQEILIERIKESYKAKDNINRLKAEYENRIAELTQENDELLNEIIKLKK